MLRRLRSPAALLFALAACGWPGVAVAPLRGPAPAGILVLRPLDHTAIPGRDLTQLGAGLDQALRERGYRVLPSDVGGDLQRRFGWPAGTAPQVGDELRLAAAAGVDAFCELEVGEFESGGERWLESASWDLTWRLRAADGALLWDWRARGTWHRPRPENVPEVADLGSDPPTRTFGEARQRSFRSAADLALALHRSAMAHLPQRSQ